MRLRSFLALSATTVAAIVVAGVLVARQPQTATAVGTGDLFFPDLIGSANQIAEVQLRHGDQTTTIVHGEHGWELKERGGYPVSLEKVKEVVVGLAQLRRLEAKTDRPERYASIGVDDVAPQANSTEVIITDAAAKPLATLLVGKAASTGGVTDAHFVRIPGEGRAWLAAGAINADPAVARWVDETVIDIPGDAVAEVKVTRPDGTTLTAIKTNADAPHFSLRELPRNHRLKSEDGVDGLAIVLTQLQLQDLAMADQIEFAAGKTSHARFRTFDGMVVDMDMVEHEGRDWVKLAVGATPESAAETKTRAAALNRQLHGYAYDVYTWKVAPLKSTLDSLIEAGSAS